MDTAYTFASALLSITELARHAVIIEFPLLKINLKLLCIYETAVGTDHCAYSVSASCALKDWHCVPPFVAPGWVMLLLIRSLFAARLTAGPDALLF
jgi:hypothetical protein